MNESELYKELGKLTKDKIINLGAIIACSKRSTQRSNNQKSCRNFSKMLFVQPKIQQKCYNMRQLKGVKEYGIIRGIQKKT